jgi:phytoene synthase
MDEPDRIARLGWVAERDPDRALASLAAPVAVREGLILLFTLDLRLAEIVDRPGEVAAVLLRLAWWRDALSALDAAAPPPEPMLRALASNLLSKGLSGTELARIPEGWLALAEQDGVEPSALEEFAAERGGTLFSLAGRLCGATDERLGRAGAGWALAERAVRERDPGRAGALADAARQQLYGLTSRRWPRRLRALGLLVVLARHDLGGGGRSRAARLLHGLRYRLTGR